MPEINRDMGQPGIGILIVSALVAIILQLVLAPVIAIFGVAPNFIMLAVIITAMHNGPVRAIIFGFVLGLIFDFCSLGPIGSMTLVLTILSYAVSSLDKDTFTGNILVDTIILLIAVALGEFLTSVIHAVVGTNPEFLLSLIQRVLPAIVYDTIIGFFMILVYNVLFAKKPSGPGSGTRSSTGRSINRKLNM